MKTDMHQKFNDEITRYKNSLLFYARKCDWETFKVNAGRLFDYVESIEMSEIERRFFNISKIVVLILCIAVAVIFKLNPELSPHAERIKEFLTLSAISGCCFEVYFFFNFTKYMQGRTAYYKKRREKFIRNIENDFRNFSLTGNG
ncbi:MAG: hypothetical protein AMK71_07665 [Nitrospira bacterium SG8_35_4]|nr:MAG: hypothetical protein AMK71_07665 [Nitrospira bacterium SG8_35_4]